MGFSCWAVACILLAATDEDEPLEDILEAARALRGAAEVTGDRVAALAVTLREMSRRMVDNGCRGRTTRKGKEDIKALLVMNSRLVRKGARTVAVTKFPSHRNSPSRCEREMFSCRLLKRAARCGC